MFDPNKAQIHERIEEIFIEQDYDETFNDAVPFIDEALEDMGL